MPTVVRVVDDDLKRVFDFVELRSYIEAKALELWPPKRSGRAGRPSGGGFQCLAEEMGISPSRLSHMLRGAERDGTIRSRDIVRLSRGLDLVPPLAEDQTALEAAFDDYTAWWSTQTNEVP